MKHTLKTFFVALVAMMVPIVGWGQTNVSTFYLPVATAIPDGVLAYTVAGVDGDYLDLKQIEGSQIPANTPVIIADSELPNSGVANASEYLLGTPVDQSVTIETGYSYFQLNVEDAIWYKVTGESFVNDAGKAYLKFPDSMVAGKEKLYTIKEDAPQNSCGENLTWTLTDGELVIEGTGAMYDFEAGTAPWYSHKDEIVKLTIKSGVTSVGHYAFNECSKIADVVIPNGVTTLGTHAFGFCDGLTVVSLPASVKTIGWSAFYTCRNLTTVNLSEGVTRIGEYSFADCGNLSKLNIPEGVTEIGQWAFRNCSFTSLILPSTLTAIQSFAFFDCYELTSLTCLATTPPGLWGEAFATMNLSVPIYVPSTSVADYQLQEQWNAFTIKAVCSSESDHNFVNGICTKCGAYEPAVDSNSDGYYEIGNAGQLYWFANYVNSGNYSARAVLTADIDLENRKWTPIAYFNEAVDPYIDNHYKGVFDGNNHVIKNLNVHVSDGSEAGLFSRITNGTLKNLGVINATVQSDHIIGGNSYRAGVLAGEINDAIITNVFSSGALSIVTDNQQKGGIAGECNYSVLTNCYTTYGALTATNVRVATNCFYLADEANASSAGTAVTAAQMASGEVAYKLGNAYGQTIGTDALPVFDGAKVYYGYTSCGAEEKIYTNDDSVTDEKEHHFADGICTECGDPYVPKITLALYDDYGDGWNGCAIIVKKDGEVLAEVTIEEGSDAIHKIEYDSSAEYTFYWKDGDWSEECSFVISVEGETVYNGNLSGDWRNNTTTPFLTLTTPYTLAFSANGGVGSHVAIKALRLVTLPECNFLAPDGKEFSAWRIGESECQAGDVVTLTENAVAYAVWKDATIAMGTLTLELHDINCESISRLQNYSYYTVTKDGELCATIRLEDDFVVSKTLEYDPNCEYAFYWHTGSDTYDTPIVYIQLNEESLFDGSGSSLEHRAEDNPFLVIPKKTRPSNVSTLNIIDGELPEYNVLREAEVGTLTYQRTLPNLEWNALFLPFEIPLSELEADYEVAYFNDMHSYDRNRDGEIDELEMEIILIDEGTLHANHPYFIRATSDDAKDLDLVLNDVTICETENAQLTCSSVYTKFDLNGSYAKKSAAELEGCYAISTEGVWAPLADGTALNPFRFYLEITQLAGSPVKVSSHALKSIRIRLNGQGDTTDIQEVPTTTTDAAVYDLSGRRVVNPGKGVYIVNGKKVMMK